MQHEEIRQAVRRFAQEQLAPNAARWDREKHFPKEALKGLAAMGLYGVAIAEEWDGAGLDYTSLAVACEALIGLPALGPFGVAMAEEWCGAGLDYTSLAVACDAIAAGFSSTATI